MFFSQFLEPIRLNREPVDWMAADLSYLELPRCAAVLQLEVFNLFGLGDVQCDDHMNS